MASVYSGKAGRNAAKWTADYLGGVKDESNQYYDEGLGKSLNSIGQARDTYNQGLGNQVSSINEGTDSAISRLDSASALYRPAYDRGEKAGSVYSDSLGLNGAEGNQRAVNSFQTGPGYQFEVDQATNAAARKASALGMGASGNTLTALATLGQNLANKEYGGWQDRLKGVSDQGMQAAGGMANIASQQAGYDYGRGQSLSGVYGQNAQNVAGTYGTEAGLYSQNASNKANTAQWAGNQIVSAGQNGMMAGQNAAANRNNLMMSGVSAGMNLLGGFAGGGWGGYGGGSSGGTSWGTGGLY
jgi:hypothetical protein